MIIPTLRLKPSESITSIPVYYNYVAAQHFKITSKYRVFARSVPPDITFMPGSWGAIFCVHAYTATLHPVGHQNE